MSDLKTRWTYSQNFKDNTSAGWFLLFAAMSIGLLFASLSPSESLWVRLGMLFAFIKAASFAFSRLKLFLAGVTQELSLTVDPDGIRVSEPEAGSEFPATRTYKWYRIGKLAYDGIGLTVYSGIDGKKLFQIEELQRLGDPEEIIDAIERYSENAVTGSNAADDAMGTSTSKSLSQLEQSEGSLVV